MDSDTSFERLTFFDFLDSVAISDIPPYSSYRDLSSLGEVSDDSNDEFNWRNDYPDDEEDHSQDNSSVNIYDDDDDDVDNLMHRAVEELDLADNRELSSDDDNSSDDRDGYTDAEDEDILVEVSNDSSDGNVA